MPTDDDVATELASSLRRTRDMLTHALAVIEAGRLDHGVIDELLSAVTAVNQIPRKISRSGLYDRLEEENEE